jgi:hypothetical protein
MSAKNIFICYRRDDAEGYAGRLYDRLNLRFPRRVFMDVTGISPGADFTRVIEDSVGTCHVLLAIMGRHWATVTDTSNRRRLDLADDYVRHEIATALRRNITVIPVLVRGAEMPSREMLPPDLAPLSTRNAIEISDGDFDHDALRLIQVLENVCGEPSPVPVPPRQASSGRNSCLIFAVIGTLVVGGLIVVLFMLGLLAASSQNNNVVQDSPKTEYSQAPVAVPSTAPSTERSEAQPDTAQSFQPVGRWIVTFEANGQRVHSDLVIYADHTFESGDERGNWEYSPEHGTLVLAGWLGITIESKEGNVFVGRGQLGYAQFPVWLTPN